MKKSILAVALLSAFALPAFADSDFNASISLGGAATPDDGSGITVSGMSYSFLLGYQVNKNFSTEVGYTSLYSNSVLSGDTRLGAS
jgi:hypothetical protein